VKHHFDQKLATDNETLTSQHMRRIKKGQPTRGSKKHQRSYSALVASAAALTLAWEPPWAGPLSRTLTIASLWLFSSIPLWLMLVHENASGFYVNSEKNRKQKMFQILENNHRF
jgi:hypothetical protein